MTCHDAEPIIARYADDEASLPEATRAALVSHLEECAACRTSAAEQRDIAAALRARLPVEPRPGLVARVSARIDREAHDEGWLGLANWRGWTAALVPVAAALFVAAYIDLGSANSTGSSTAVPTVDEWVATNAPAAVSASVSGEELIETVLTGAAPSTGDPDVR